MKYIHDFRLNFILVEGVSFFVLCGMYVWATRLVHGHHEKIVARPCKESHTAEDGRKHVFRCFRGFAGYFEELVCARITRYSRSVFFVDLGVTQAIVTNNQFLFYFIDATFCVVTYRCL